MLPEISPSKAPGQQDANWRKSSSGSESSRLPDNNSGGGRYLMTASASIGSLTIASGAEFIVSDVEGKRAIASWWQR